MQTVDTVLDIHFPAVDCIRLLLCSLVVLLLIRKGLLRVGLQLRRITKVTLVSTSPPPAAGVGAAVLCCWCSCWPRGGSTGAATARTRSGGSESSSGRRGTQTSLSG